jgi:hypothetical protein
VTGDDERERLGAGMVGEAEREWLSEKIGACSESEEGSMRPARPEWAGDVAREEGVRDEG